jgi:uncharacterized metal-binding protein YceD (DUF177 family)
MPVKPEFCRPVAIDRAERDGETHIAADAAERAALVRRFRLAGLDRLEATYMLAKEAGGFLARGRIVADLAQACVATGEPVAESIDAPFTLRFLPAGLAAPDAEEVELREEDCDTLFYEGGTIDMGEAAAETLALTMNPWPRARDADEWLAKAGVKREEEMSPFAVLKGLTKKG